ncbi:MAG: hypothetical protein IJH75_04920 [Mogibacterium sp.]|nr:hypothetical protein [Mogibacterium sp.]
MNPEKKVELVMNLMYNLLLAVILSAIAEIINAGGIQWPGLLIDIVISFILEMIISMGLPLAKWGAALGMKHAKPGSPKFKVIMTGCIAIPFAFLMSAAMSFIGIKMAGAPTFAWGPAFLKVWPVFTVLAWILSYFLIPPFMGLARKICGVPEQQHHQG